MAKYVIPPHVQKARQYSRRRVPYGRDEGEVVCCTLISEVAKAVNLDFKLLDPASPDGHTLARFLADAGLGDRRVAKPRIGALAFFKPVSGQMLRENVWHVGIVDVNPAGRACLIHACPECGHVTTEPFPPHDVFDWALEGFASWPAT